jgi:hypothetical protein
MSITHEMLLDVAQCTGTALERADAVMKRNIETQEKVASAIPGVAKKLVDAGLIEAHEGDELKRVLADHDKAVELMGKIAMHYASTVSTLKSEGIGKPVESKTTKSASVNGGGYVGARTGGLTDADRVWYQQVLGTVPE